MLRLGIALAISLALLVPAPADAQPADGAKPATEVDIRTGRAFWEWLAEPYGVEIATVLRKAGDNLNEARSRLRDTSTRGSAVVALRDAEKMLRWALDLSPDHAGMLELLAEAQYMRGDITAAHGTLLRLQKKVTADALTPTAQLLLGQVAAARGSHEAAIVHLREAVHMLSGWRGTNAVLALAQVYMETHRIPEAIAMLSEGRRPSDYPGTLAVALAVAYDRDEQHAKAKKMLDKVGLSGGYGTGSMVATTGELRFAPAIDRHYFMALLLTHADRRAEARREWMSYLAAGKRATYRRRAAQHLATLSAPKVHKSKPAVGPARVRPRRPPHRWRHRP